jgi:hypothetical protein
MCVYLSPALSKARSRCAETSKLTFFIRDMSDWACDIVSDLKLYNAVTQGVDVEAGVTTRMCLHRDSRAAEVAESQKLR